MFFGLGEHDSHHPVLTHDLELKPVGHNGPTTFDALACDGAGNYAKCRYGDQDEIQVIDFKARAYGKESKRAIQGWLVGTYHTDEMKGLSPLVEDTQLLSLLRAAQKAQAALREGAAEVCVPLGFEARRVLNYRAVKLSAFVFRTPEQRAAVLKQLQKFEDRTGCGLELLALRRTYSDRKQGSIAALVRRLEEFIRAGGTNLTRAFNLNKARGEFEYLTSRRTEEHRQRRCAAEYSLRERMDATSEAGQEEETVLVLRADDLVTLKSGTHSLILGGDVSR